MCCMCALRGIFSGNHLKLIACTLRRINYILPGHFVALYFPSFDWGDLIRPRRDNMRPRTGQNLTSRKMWCTLRPGHFEHNPKKKNAKRYCVLLMFCIILPSCPPAPGARKLSVSGKSFFPFLAVIMTTKFTCPNCALRHETPPCTIWCVRGRENLASRKLKSDVKLKCLAENRPREAFFDLGAMTTLGLPPPPST